MDFKMRKTQQVGPVDFSSSSSFFFLSLTRKWQSNVPIPFRENVLEVEDVPDLEKTCYCSSGLKYVASPLSWADILVKD